VDMPCSCPVNTLVSTLQRTTYAHRAPHKPTVDDFLQFSEEYLKQYSERYGVIEGCD